MMRGAKLANCGAIFDSGRPIDNAVIGAAAFKAR
jgi:hypothetical protein